METNFGKNVPSAAAIEVPSTVTPAPAPVPVPVPAAAPTPVPVPTPAPATPAAPTAPVNPAPAPAPAPATALAPIPANNGIASSNSLLLGDKLPDFDDIMMPRLNIAQQIGDLKDTFTPGTIVFGQQVGLWTPPFFHQTNPQLNRPGTEKPIVVTCLGFRPTRYVEKVKNGRGLIVKTEDEVRANGGTLSYQEWKQKEAAGMKYFQPLAEGLFAIERPDHIADDDTVFVYQVGTKKYALALWGMKGTSYTEAAKKVFFSHRMMGALRAGYPTFSYNLTTRWKDFPNQGQGGGAWIPVVIGKEKTTPEFLEFVKSVLNPAQAAPTGAE